MSKSEKTESAVSEAPRVEDGPSPAAPTPQAPVLDETDATCGYANFCRVTGSPEELVVDFGLRIDPAGSQEKPIAVNQRVVMNFYTAKRLLQTLHVAIQRHEATFGDLETNIQKRVQPTKAK